MVRTEYRCASGPVESLEEAIEDVCDREQDEGDECDGTEFLAAGELERGHVPDCARADKNFHPRLEVDTTVRGAEEIGLFDVG